MLHGKSLEQPGSLWVSLCHCEILRMQAAEQRYVDDTANINTQPELRRSDTLSA